MFKLRILLLLICGLMSCEVVLAATTDSQIVAGAGPSTEIVQLFFNEFGKLPVAAGTQFTVMAASVKHAGGLKNSDIQLFGRTGRPLKDDEKSIGKKEILLGRVKIAFASGRETGIKNLNVQQLKEIFTRKVTNWKDVGGSNAPILLLGRDRNEAVFSVLREEYPWFNEVNFDKTFKTDDELMKFIPGPEGRHAIAFGAQSQLPNDQLIAITEMNAGLKIGLVYDVKNENHPLVKAAQQYSNSKEWRNVLKQQGQLALR